jgi:hypothetical protein
MGLLDQEDEAADEIVEDVLRAEAHADRQRTAEEGESGEWYVRGDEREYDKADG